MALAHDLTGQVDIYIGFSAEIVADIRLPVRGIDEVNIAERDITCHYTMKSNSSRYSNGAKTPYWRLARC